MKIHLDSLFQTSIFPKVHFLRGYLQTMPTKVGFPITKVCSHIGLDTTDQSPLTHSGRSKGEEMNLTVCATFS